MIERKIWGQSSLLTQIVLRLELGDTVPPANSIRGGNLSLDEPGVIGVRRFFAMI